MSKKLSNRLQTVYGWIALVTMALGFIVFLMFFVALLIGGSGGSALAVAAGDLMSWAIRLAAIAIVIGLVCVYFKKEHTLNIKTEQKSTVAN